MLMRICLWTFIAVTTVTASVAQQSHEGSYSCTTEASGGIFYNDQTKKWDGTRFRPFRKFVLRLKYVRTAAEGDEHSATVTSDGRNDSLPCVSNRMQLVQLNERGVLICRTEFYDYRFNLKSGRFVETYLMGYVDGQNTNDDTPMVSGGRCTKIE